MIQVHLVDGTYELFRHHFALPSHRDRGGREVAATRGVAASMLGLLEDGATHVGVATDHVVESCRNDLYDGYKDGSGVEADILGQFGLLEEVLEALGIVVFPMVDYEADDALGAAAVRAAADERVERVLICTPDKDLSQCVGGKVFQYDRRKQSLVDHAAVVDKFGVEPASIPDYLALVGDSADGFPGLAGWGARSAATVLARYGRIEGVPPDPADWDVKVRGAAKLAETLRDRYDQALLFRRIATVVTDVETFDDVEDLRWRGPAAGLSELAGAIDAPRLVERAHRLAEQRH